MLPEQNMQQILSLMETIQELMMGYELTDTQYEELKTFWFDVEDMIEGNRPLLELEEMEAAFFDNFHWIDELPFEQEYPCIFVDVDPDKISKEELRPERGIIYARDLKPITEDFILPSPLDPGNSNQVLIVDVLGQPKWIDPEETLFNDTILNYKGKITIEDPIINCPNIPESSTENLTIIGAFDDAMKVVDD